MKFLIQKIDGKVIHDFSIQLLEAIKYYEWYYREKISVKYINTESTIPIDEQLNSFKKFHKKYVPIGSVEFVEAYIHFFYRIKIKPINVPNELIPFAQRTVINSTEEYINVLLEKDRWFIKSNDKVKGYAEMRNLLFVSGKNNLPKGNYQYSEYVNIYSEYRAFVYRGKLVGLKHYSGDFTLFPDISKINEMIIKYSSQPVAYTLDVGINNVGTFVIEVHNFYSCGLYGFNSNILLRMYSSWFDEFLLKNTMK